MAVGEGRSRVTRGVLRPAARPGSKPIRKPVPRIIAITSLEPNPGPTFTLDAWIESLGERGVEAIQVRDKEAPDRSIHDFCLALRERLPDRISLLVNARPDIALAVGARGVHLPADGLPLGQVRRHFGDELLIGRSTHSAAEVETARDQGADYVLFGPVYSTPEKVGYGPPQGLEALAAAAAVGVPVIAVGGMTAARVPEVLEHGAHGVAGIRWFASAGR